MNFIKILTFFICSSLLTLAACHSKSPPATGQPATKSTTRQPVMQTKEPTGNQNKPLPGPTGQPERIPPGSCRLVGKVLAIIPDLEADKQTACGQVPCKALVKVDKILGYGSAFGQPLTHNQEIKVYFHFTLGPTGRYFPELTTPLPGLTTGSIFQADVTRAGDGGMDKSAWFGVYTYLVKN